MRVRLIDQIKRRAILEQKFATIREWASPARRTTIPGCSQQQEGAPSMCDYSLDHVASRPANVQDKLVTTNFHNSITRGFAGVGEAHVAVCLRPGTEIAFENNVECEPAFGLLPSKKIGQKIARFRQVNMEQPSVHHDALEFPDGQVVLVARLRVGQRATVLQLPATAAPV